MLLLYSEGISSETNKSQSMTGLNGSKSGAYPYMSTPHYLRQVMGTEKQLGRGNDPTGKSYIYIEIINEMKLTLFTFKYKSHFLSGDKLSSNKHPCKLSTLHVLLPICR